MLFNSLLLFDADKGGAGATDGDQGAGKDKDDDKGGTGAADGDNKPLVWETWLKEQSDDIKTLIGDHTSGLKSSLASERQGKKELAKSLKELKVLAEEHPQLKTQIEGIEGKLGDSETKTAFVLAAVTAKVSDPILALAAANQAGMLADEKFQDRKGKVIFEDLFEDLKTKHPQLFAVQKAPDVGAGAGAGKGGNAGTGGGVNEWIRGRAGIK